MIFQMAALERIRSETRGLHQAIERSNPLSSARVSLQDYRRYLEKLLGFHAPLELRLAAMSEQHGLTAEFAGRSKTPLVVRDLAALGLRPATAVAVAWSPWLPQPVGLGGLLGCAYVLEGATLGGKVILRRLAPQLPEIQGASRYLDCYGDQVGERWKRLLALLETHLVTPEAEQAAVAAARDSFQALARWLAYPRPVTVA